MTIFDISKEDSEESQFWFFIGIKEVCSSEEQFHTLLVYQLSQAEDKVIFSFDDVLHRLAFSLDTWALWAVSCEVTKQTMVSFRNARLSALTYGKSYYQKVLEGGNREIWKQNSFWLYDVPKEAYAMKHNISGNIRKSYPHRVPKCRIATGSNKNGWMQLF